MSSSRPAAASRRRWGLLLAAVALLSAAGCMYPWDDLRSENSDEALCSYLCGTYEECISAEPGCESSCESDINECPTVQKDTLRDCVDDLSSDCGDVASQTTYEVCVALVPCYN